MNLDPLYQPAPPWIVAHRISSEEKSLMASFLYCKPESSPVIRVLRGLKMKTRQALMDEFGAALQLFEGFGENWHALRECLCYMDEWLPGGAYILVITHAESLLSQEPEEVRWLLTVVHEAGEWWRTPITDNGRFNRPAVPFHVVLQCEAGSFDQVVQRFPQLTLL